jgi:hypothetical protein
MVWYYVIFNGKNAGIYQSWHECGVHIIGKSGILHQKYKTYDEAVRAFETHRAPPALPFAQLPVVHVDPPTVVHENHLSQTKVLIIFLVTLLVALWMHGGKNERCACPD